MKMILTSRGILRKTRRKLNADAGKTDALAMDAVLQERSSATGTAPIQNETSKRLVALADQVAYRLRGCRREIQNCDANVILFESCELELRRAASLLSSR